MAGCDDMTSAWLVDEAHLGAPASFAIPLPPSRDRPWGTDWARAIGLTKNGQIRIVRFYGFPTGCETPGCSLPPPSYSVTTIDTQDTRDATHVTNQLDFIVDTAGSAPLRLSADATWAYAEVEVERAKVLRLATGALARIVRLGDPVGTEAGSALLYGSKLDSAAGTVVIWSVDRAGTRRRVATVAWPAGVHPEETSFRGTVIQAVGLQFLAPTRLTIATP